MKGVDEKELTTTPLANSRSTLKKRKAASAKEKKKEKSIEETKKSTKIVTYQSRDKKSNYIVNISILLISLLFLLILSGILLTFFTYFIITAA